MSNVRPDPRWPKVLSLTVHEFRTPMTVVAGYIRMLLKERAGPLSDVQRQLLTEAERSCARLSTLIGELSELSGLEGGTASFNRTEVELGPLLAEVVGSLPPLADREVHIDLSLGGGRAPVRGDRAKLNWALSAIFQALRRELVTSDRLFLRERVRQHHGRAVAWIALADADRIDALTEADDAALATFDEWRGGCGLSLPVARRILEAHGACIWSPVEGTRAGAVIAVPLSGAERE